MVTVRRAAVDDAAVVRTMLLELATHEDTAHAVHATIEDWRRMLASPAAVVLLAYADDRAVGYAHRFYRRLGATLRAKVVAAWHPSAYGQYVDNLGSAAEATRLLSS